MTPDVHVSGTSGAAFLDHLRPREVPGRTTIDLTRMRFCEPLGLVGIAAVVERAVACDEEVLIRRPADDNVANYVARMRLGLVLSGLGVAHDLPVVREKYLGDALLELRAFDGEGGVSRLAELVHANVENADLDAANALYAGICEAGQNVTQHARRTGGFVAAQRIPASSTLRFAVGDSGVGMLGTLRTRGATDDLGALDLALRSGISETDDAARGNGLPDLVAQLRRLRGSLNVVSGRAAVTAYGARRYLTERDLALPGTVVQGIVPAPR